jgi:hypothetical protein
LLSSQEVGQSGVGQEKFFSSNNLFGTLTSTTPSAPAKEAMRLFVNGAATPPLLRRGLGRPRQFATPQVRQVSYCPEGEKETAMKQSPKAKSTKKNIKVKDLALKNSESKNVKGGAVGPCGRAKN